jgi:hypothetical protein
LQAGLPWPRPEKSTGALSSVVPLAVARVPPWALRLAVGTAIATQPSKPQPAQTERVVVQKETVVVHEREPGCWPPGHCKPGKKNKH